MSLRNFNLKLKTLIPLIILGVLIPFGIAIIGLTYIESLSDIEHNAKDRLEQQLSQLSLNLGEIHSGGGLHGEAQRLISTMAVTEGLLHLSLVDESEKVLASTRFAWVGQKMSGVWSGFQRDVYNKHLLDYREIYLPNTSNGTFQAYHSAELIAPLNRQIRAKQRAVIVAEYSYKSQYELLEKRLQQKALVFFVLLFVVLGFVVSLLRSFITRPIDNLGSYISNIELGEKPENLKAMGSQELETLAQKLVQMRSRLDKMKLGLEQANTMLRGHIDAVPDMIFFKDMDGKFIGGNQALCAVLGQSSMDDVIGKTDFDFLEKDVAESIRIKDLEVFEKGETIQFKESVEGANQKRYLFDTLKAPYKNRDGQVIGLIGIARDITDKEKLETAIESLVTSVSSEVGEDFFTAAVESMQQWTGAEVVILSELVTAHEARALSMIVDGKKVEGYSYNLVGTPCADASSEGFCSYPDDIINLFPEDEDLQKLGVKSYVGTPVRNKKGEAIGILCALSRQANFFGDMVESVFKVMAERASVEMERKLLESELIQAQKMDAVGTLAGGIAHDFNNTLAGITGNIYLAKKDVKHLPKVFERLGNIEKLSFHAASMIQQLLTFSRKGIMQMKEVNMHTFIQETLNLYQLSLPERVVFTQDIEDRDMIVEADENQLQQVIINLINNANHALDECLSPEIKLSLSYFEVDDLFLKRNPQVKGHRMVRMSITDNGSGIAPENLERIFEPFFSTKEYDDGTGLGLAMVYGIIESHHGTIQVSSKLGKGTKVNCYLPLVDNPEISSHLALASGHAASGEGECVLLADDNKAVQEVGESVLTDLGYKVLLASDGLEAVNIYEQRQDIKLVVLDVAMPVMGGIEAAKRIKKINSNAKIIFATGYDFSQELHEGSDIVEAVVMKPFDVVKFSHTVKQALDKE